MKVKRNLVLRTGLVFWILIGVAVSILFRIGKIQFQEEEKWQNLAVGITQRYLPIEATRGDIYAEGGELLVTSLSYYQLCMDPSLPDYASLKVNMASFTRRLAKYFDEKPSGYYQKIILEHRKRGKKYLLLSRKELTYKQKKELLGWPFVREGRLSSGVFFKRIEKRHHPFHPTAQRTLGYVNWDHRGAVGIEHSFDRVLSGRDGKMLVERTTGGWYPVPYGPNMGAEHGHDVQTTLKLDIQQIAQEELAESLEKYQAEKGIAIVMEVETGAIRALSNLSRIGENEYEEQYNYAIGEEGSVEPGSTFKLASMMALLEKTQLKLQDTVDTGTGSHEFGGEVMKDVKEEGFGKLTAEEAFQMSSNIGMAKLVMRHFGDRPDRLVKYLRELRIDQKLGFQIKGEAQPYLRTPEDSLWSGTSLAWLAHGYEIQTTPLQILMLYNTVANQGRMLKPYVVEKVQDKEGRVVRAFGPQVTKRKVVSESTLRQVQKLLEGVVQHGTAHKIKGTPYRIAGKTGTTKKHENGQYVAQYYASFVGYFPAEKPKYSCIIVIDGPKGALVHGGDVAAPVFRRIADRIYRQDVHMHRNELPLATVRPDAQVSSYPWLRAGYGPQIQRIVQFIGVDIPENPYAWGRTQWKEGQLFWKNTLYEEAERMPNLQGMTLRNAFYLLENEGFSRIKISGRGRVVQQHPLPGNLVKAATPIHLHLLRP